MASVSKTVLPLLDASSVQRAVLNLRPTPARRDTSPLWDAPEDEREGLARIQVQEDGEYLFDLESIDSSDPALWQPSELFDVDDESGRHGRLRPRLQTGAVTIETSIGGEILRGTVEVRSRKLTYLEDYRWMLGGIAEQAAELLMQRFAAARLNHFAIDEGSSARSVYQQFCYLQARLAAPDFEASMQRIISAPDRTFEPEIVRRPAQAGAPATSATVRAFARPGPRLAAETAPLGLPPPPRWFDVPRHEESLDTDANRFVLHALRSWLAVLRLVEDRFRAATTGGPDERGRREAAALRNKLDSWLAAGIWRGVGVLDRHPGGNQVLMKRPGYRDVLHTYLQSQAASRLSWDGAEDVFGAGQRDVAALYEFWAYLQLVEVVKSLCGDSVDVADLIADDGETMTLKLRRGVEAVVSGSATVEGRRLDLRLFFNKTFGARTGIDGDGSWSLQFRPDCSLEVARTSFGGRTAVSLLHFDAKYRLDKISDVDGVDQQGDARRDDLLKMHAYRDAIRRTSGAYVLYPGTETRELREYREVVPGVGAFPLRPAQDGRADAAGAGRLRHFVESVMRHLASDASAEERAAFWAFRSFEKAVPASAPLVAAPSLASPPADTQVLLGYVKSPEHWRWICRGGREPRRYNLRADGRPGAVPFNAQEATPDLVVFYGPGTTQPIVARVRPERRVVVAAELGVDYPDPRGTHYIVLELGDDLTGRIAPDADGVLSELVEAAVTERRGGKPFGAPIALSWQELLAAH